MQDVDRAECENIIQVIENMMREVCREEEWQARLVVCVADGILLMTGAHEGTVSRVTRSNMHV